MADVARAAVAATTGHGLDELPVWRQEQLLWRFALSLDWWGVDDRVRTDSAMRSPCGTPRVYDRREWRAARGDDDRWHLLDEAGRVQCGDPFGGRGHWQTCWWRIDAALGAVRCANNLLLPGFMLGEARWRVQIVEQAGMVDPRAVRPRDRCPGAPGLWPPAAQQSAVAVMQAYLVRRYGPDCQCCRSDQGEIVDHDPFTGVVRGLVCRNCNNLAELCPHLPGQCHVIDYLTRPPLAGLVLRYPHQAVTVQRAQPRIEALGFSPLAAPNHGRWPGERPSQEQPTLIGATDPSQLRLGPAMRLSSYLRWGDRQGVGRVVRVWL